MKNLDIDTLDAVLETIKDLRVCIFLEDNRDRHYGYLLALNDVEEWINTKMAENT